MRAPRKAPGQGAQQGSPWGPRKGAQRGSRKLEREPRKEPRDVEEDGKGEARPNQILGALKKAWGRGGGRRPGSGLWGEEGPGRAPKGTLRAVLNHRRLRSIDF
jgi:hypothetical protein